MEARSRFHGDLQALRGRVVAMAALARSMLTDGVASLVALDTAKAQTVLARKDDLAAMDDEIEEEALLLVARQQPMARDMREIAAA
ncbi:MAG TPA: PhoU domain-containing protein, partial [Alphaproteobacteria bacterium]